MNSTPRVSVRASILNFPRCRAFGAIGMATTIWLGLAGSALAQPHQIGLKFGQSNNGNLQTAAPAIQPNDLAGIPSYAQTNWIILGRFGNNSTNTSGTNAYALYDSGGDDTHVTLQWDATGQFGLQ